MKEVRYSHKKSTKWNGNLGTQVDLPKSYTIQCLSPEMCACNQYPESLKFKNNLRIMQGSSFITTLNFCILE